MARGALSASPDRLRSLPDRLNRERRLARATFRANVQPMQQELDRLRDLVTRHSPDRITETAVGGLRLHAATAPTSPASGVFEPAFCLVLQGAKSVTIGDRTLRYDPACYFVASIAVPAVGCIIEASPERPYLSISMTICRETLASLLADSAPDEPARTTSFAVSAVTPALLGSMSRLVELLDTPQDIPTLEPLLRREILYRLLQGDQAGLLRQVARTDSRLSQVHRAVRWIRGNLDAPLSVDALADLAGMSRASFHRHFKAATALSPVQYQKTLRLQEARRLLLARTDAQAAAYRVGYQSASQFSREYARLFGASPARDALRLRGEPALDPAP
jgi:AraC-like DNA-binding protein